MVICTPSWGPIEFLLHGIVFAFGAVVPVLMYIAYTRFLAGPLKKIIKYYAIAMSFAALHAILGSMLSLDVPGTETMFFDVSWTLVGVFAALFGLYATKLLLDFGRVFGFAGKPAARKGKKRP